MLTLLYYSKMMIPITIMFAMIMIMLFNAVLVIIIIDSSTSVTLIDDHHDRPDLCFCPTSRDLDPVGENSDILANLSPVSVRRYAGRLICFSSDSIRAIKSLNRGGGSSKIIGAIFA